MIFDDSRMNLILIFRFAKIEAKKNTVDFRGQLKTTEKKEFSLEDIMKEKEARVQNFYVLFLLR